MAPPSADELRLSPPVRRCHQFPCFCRASSFSSAVVHAGARDSGFAQCDATMTPEEMVSRLLYRDGLMLVIDKPAGMAVHHGPNSGGESLRRSFRRACASACRGRRRWRTGSTATRPAAWCSAATARRWRSSASCSRTAPSTRPIGPWSKAGPTPTKATIELPLGRLDATRGWWMKHDPEGQPAVTKWKVMGRGPRS